MTVLTKVACGKFEIWNFNFFSKKWLKFSSSLDPMGVKISKHYSSHSYDSFSTKLFLNVPCDSPHKSCLQEFWNLKFHFFFQKWLKISSSSDPMGVKILQRTPPLLLQLWFFFHQTISECSLRQSSQKLSIKVLKIQISNFKISLKFIIVANGEMKNCQYLGNG